MTEATIKNTRTLWGKSCLLLFIVFCVYAGWGFVKLLYFIFTHHPAPDAAAGTYLGEFIGTMIGLVFYLIIGAPLGFLAWYTRAK